MLQAKGEGKIRVNSECQTTEPSDLIKVSIAYAVKFTVDRQAIAEVMPATSVIEEKPLDYAKYAEEQTAKATAAASFASEEEYHYAAIQCSLDDPEGCEMCGS